MNHRPTGCQRGRRGSRSLVVMGITLALVLSVTSLARAQQVSTAKLALETGPADYPHEAPSIDGSFECLPWQLLWQPPLASPRQPRLFVKPTNLENEFTRQTIDTALGATVGLFRSTPCAWPDTAFQLDFLGGHFSRWSERHLAVAGDYRWGVLLTARSGPWQGKLGYEHTSTHLGDDFIRLHNRFKVQYVRDEVVLGVAYRWWNQLRAYGEVGLAFDISSPVENGSERFAWGVEWSRQEPTGWKGQPFAAFDMDLRPEQEYQPNMTLQVGWQWIPPSQRGSFRLALELYDGLSPFGQFLTTKERWAGLAILLDF